MQFLKADTTKIVRIGPAVDITDGYTNLATLDISTADYAYMMHGDSVEVDISSNTWAAVTNVTGFYDLTLTNTQLTTEGPMTVAIYDVSLCLPIFKDFMVVSGVVYDSLFNAAATDYLPIDLIQMGGSSTSGTDLKDFADNGFDTTDNVVRSDLIHVNGDTAGAAKLEQIANNAIPFTCDDTGDAATVKTSLSGTYTTDDAFVGRVAIFDYDTPNTAAMKGQAGVITSYNGTTGDLGFAGGTFTTASVSGDTGIIL